MDFSRGLPSWRYFRPSADDPPRGGSTPRTVTVGQDPMAPLALAGYHHSSHPEPPAPGTYDHYTPRQQFFLRMQESFTSVTSPAITQPAPLHDDIAQCARDLWVQCGRPADRDLAIWLEAEQRLRAATEAVRGKNFGSTSSWGRSADKPARATVLTGAPVFRASSLRARVRATPML